MWINNVGSVGNTGLWHMLQVVVLSAVDQIISSYLYSLHLLCVAEREFVCRVPSSSNGVIGTLNGSIEPGSSITLASII